MPHITITEPAIKGNGMWREIHRAILQRHNILIQCTSKERALSIRNTLRRYARQRGLPCVLKVQESVLMVAFM